MRPRRWATSVTGWWDLLAAASRCAIDTGRSILLKIDTQGFEMPVLQGARNLLQTICGLQLELSLTQLYDGQVLYLDMIHWLRDRGFELWNVMPGFVEPASGRLLQMDGVFFRSE